MLFTVNCPVGGRRLDAEETLLDEATALDELVGPALRELDESAAVWLDTEDRLDATELWLLLDAALTEPPLLALGVSLGRNSDDPADGWDWSESADALEKLELLDALPNSGPGSESCSSGPGLGGASRHPGSHGWAHPQPRPGDGGYGGYGGYGGNGG